MSNLNDLNMDANVAEDDGTGSGGQVIPNGKYKAVMVAENLENNKNENGKVWKIKMQIIEGQYTDNIQFDNINATNPSKVCQDIGQGVIKRICRITGVPFPPNDCSLMFGKPMLITVNVKPKWNDSSKKQNEITAYNPVPNDFVAVTPDKATQVISDVQDKTDDLEW
ncbi:MAG: DUF669 domain-containing protein [Desulfosarcina sp.]|nr:DUF669 domain-containing protein [Desulfobacterales bacterium]